MTLPIAKARPMTGLQCEASCPRCPGALEYVAEGIQTGTHSRALVRCTRCRHEYQAWLGLVPLDTIR